MQVEAGRGMWYFQDKGLSEPRQVEGFWAEPAPLPGCGAERRSHHSVEQGARACSIKLWGVLLII